MPELPEVETICRLLAPNVAGKKILRVRVRLPRLLRGVAARSFSNRTAGQRVMSLIRRGKYLCLELERDAIIVHLGMTGQLTFTPRLFKENSRFLRTVTGLQKARGVHPVDKHTHLVFHLESGERVLFRDPRTFGRIFWVPDGKWGEHPRIGKLGPEPLEIRIPTFCRDHFPSQSVRSIKSLLLDQSFLAGVGNIYADEALFASGIHPARKVSSISLEESILLIGNVKKVLRRGIRNLGTSFSDYRKPDGSRGGNFQKLKVYGKGGEPCVRCGKTLVKTVVAQRGTVFCPVCQG